MTIAKLPVFYKPRDLLFYPAWAYALPKWITKIPISFLEVGVWVFTTYYVVGFDPNVGRMFRQYLLLFLVNQLASGLFRLVGRDMIIAMTFAFFAVIIFMVLGGFILSREQVKKWWIWGYWISPMMYGQNALAVNEFLGRSWREVIRNTGSDSVEVSWYWIGVGAIVGYIILFNGLFTLALTYLKPFGKSHANISEEELNERHINRTGEEVFVELSSLPSSKQKASIAHANIEGSNNENSKSGMSYNSMTDQSDAMASGQERMKGMVLPFTPLSLAFDNIRYSVDMPLKIVYYSRVGTIRPGVLTAVMGVSGAGKTTLMDVLAGRKTGGHIDGTINVSGYPKKQETFAHSPQVTMFVEEVMELVELKSIRNALVGLPGVNELLTEQRKRLTIAVELVANTSIIFMDEPTSGLDARAAAIVMRTVRKTVDTGRTVMCTIQQPSIDIFEAFDELFLMKRGGEAIYVGPLGSHSHHLIEYFEGINGVSKIKEGYNPAAWVLEATSEAQEDMLGVHFSEIYKNSDLYRNKELVKELSSPTPGSKDLRFPTQYSQPYLTQCLACLWKQHW
ncbi:hypothetical protein AMTR_s00122p00120860 [Amborella trichopoda]|uniref:ABC transporter domain-containing protein n=1 Tax=Amborella trichopoda TaxID=13333 RepID=W1NQI4_AMBTC|nr:hypothetical protein AMTR_s00122p00120860 [Amborella trichopoda]